VISSPSFDKEQLIGVLSITDSRGITQAKAIKEILESWNLWDSVHSVCFDTTSSNTGEKNKLNKIIKTFYDILYYDIFVFS